MSPNALSVFAQVIPALIIAVFLSRLGLQRIPLALRGFMIFCLFVAAIGEIAVLCSLAFEIPLGASMTRGVFASTGLLLLLLLVTAVFLLLSRRVPTDYEDPRPSADER